MNDQPPYKLSEARNEQIFRESILPELLDKSGELHPSVKPTMIVVAGQPGAGKSTAIKGIAEAYKQNGGVLKAVLDDLRENCPDYFACKIIVKQK